MVMACGGDTSELEPVFMNCGGYKVNANQEIYSAGMEDLVNCNTHRAYHLKRHVLTQCLRDCYQWHFFWLLAYIMKMSKYRENVGRLDAFRSALNEMSRGCATKCRRWQCVAASKRGQGRSEIVSMLSKYP